MSSNQRHNFHLVDPSPWPLVTSIGLLGMAVGGVMFFHKFLSGGTVFFLGLITVIYTAILWWRDVVREGTYEGRHTTVVQKGLRYGMLLFILSEVMFFFAFFWAFFHSSLAPAIELGSVWPPVGMNVFSPWEIPLLNTVILLLSGATITWAHHAIVVGNFQQGLVSMYITIALAIFFTNLQVCEYIEAEFNISDSVYGSTFFLATGFHGFHVIIGTLFITVCIFRHYFYHFSKHHHFGFEAAAWYWHFVDVVWLFLFISIYWWGNSLSI